MEEAFQKRINIQRKKEVYSEEVDSRKKIDSRAYFLKFTMFLLSAGSLANAGFLTTSANNIKKYEENER